MPDIAGLATIITAIATLLVAVGALVVFVGVFVLIVRLGRAIETLVENMYGAQGGGGSSLRP